MQAIKQMNARIQQQEALVAQLQADRLLLFPHMDAEPERVPRSKPASSVADVSNSPAGSLRCARNVGAGYARKERTRQFVIQR